MERTQNLEPIHDQEPARVELAGEAQQLSEVEEKRLAPPSRGDPVLPLVGRVQRNGAYDTTLIPFGGNDDPLEDERLHGPLPPAAAAPPRPRTSSAGLAAVRIRTIGAVHTD